MAIQPHEVAPDAVFTHTPRFNNMRKNFSAMVETDVTVV